MCDYDPPLDRTYDPEFPLESEQEESDDDREKAPDHSQVPPKKSRWSSPKRRPAPKMPAPELFCALRAYSQKQFYPVEQDPECYPAWALSPYWPVYVSNFRLNSLDEPERNAQIATFFACHGLLTRMIFIRENDDPFFQNHQSKTLLLDMLVYFICKADAERAIRCCDKQSYYGHVLNVFPGRVSVYFDPGLTVRFQIPERFSVEHTETPTELAFKRRGSVNITTIAKHSECELFVEFENRLSMNLAVTQCDLWIPSRLTEPVRKQRFLENDCKYHMMFLLQENPDFINMLPPENVLQDLLRGRLPLVIKDWEGLPFPKELPEEVRNSIYRDKIENLYEYETNSAGFREAVRRQKEIFFAHSQQQQQKPVGTTSTASSQNDRYAVYQEIVDRKQKSFEEKFSMIRVPNRNNNPNLKIEPADSQPTSTAKPVKPWSVASNKGEKTFRDKKVRFLTKRWTLLKRKGVRTLADRNELFFELLRLEKSLGKLTTKRGDFQCDELRTGLIVAMQNMNQLHIFSKWFTNPYSPRLLALADTATPLDSLTPVFVSNFSAPDLNQMQRNQQIKALFGTKNLSVYLVYLNESDNFYNSYQKHVHLLDMLVYFRTEKEAETAIESFHGTTYQGHKLGVFPGRVAKHYEPNKTVFLELDDDPTVAEEMIARFLSSETLPFEDLDSVVRYPKKAIFMFTNPRQGKAVVNLQLSVKLVKTPLPMKQRYLEADVKADLMRKILRDADFLKEQPRAADTLRCLFAVKSLPPEEEDIAGVVWEDDDYQKRKDMNDRIGKVLDEWVKLQGVAGPSSQV